MLECYPADSVPSSLGPGPDLGDSFTASACTRFLLCDTLECFLFERVVRFRGEVISFQNTIFDQIL